MTFRTSLSLPPRLELESWKEIGQKISRISDSSTWWLGDWLIYGRNRFPERYRRAIAETSLDYQTLRNYAWIARKFAVSRRRGALSFQHHAEVAALSEDEQDLWLGRAEEGNWSRNELRQRLKPAQAGTEAVPVAVDSIKLQISQDQKKRWEVAASGLE
ncbi:LmbU family transcriptional regulator, partial [Streptomyces albospinus]|uniref:LmbU family transcriptional regulator n=1 Tax=Streptomyces albospinus TaxID=285515 RepID=UPI001E39C90D